MQTELISPEVEKAVELQALADEVYDIDFNLSRQGLPSFTQLSNSLRNAVATIDILLKHFYPDANPEHFASMARLDIADIERKLGQVLNH